MDIANRLSTAPETVRQAERRATRDAALIGADLHWRRIGSGWRLFDGRRRFGEIVPDSTYPNMWRPVLTGGRLGDMANIKWAKHAVLEAAVRELEWEGRRNRATNPSKCPEKRGVSEGARPQSFRCAGGYLPSPQHARAAVMNRRPTRSAVLVERRALPNWCIHPERQQMREAFERRERQRLGLPPMPPPGTATAETRRGDGAVRELMDPSREATAALPSPSLRSSRSALSPTGATASAYPPSSKPARRASLRSGAETAGGWAVTT
jgi:hypothetical protein